MLYKPRITQNDVKRHLHDIRYQRQKQSTLIIDECHQLRIKHKHIFDCQLNSYSTEKTFPIKSEFINQQTELENDLPFVKELTEYLCESSYLFLDNQISNKRILSSGKNKQQRCLSVSSVGSIDKRRNKVYEKWPDYTQISQIVGYRIEKPPPIEISSPADVKINQKKQKKSTRFVDAAKQITNMAAIERDVFINKPIDEQKMSVLNTSPEEIKPKLPSILCPSSKNYSKRIQTRQWLTKNFFSPQTLSLV